MDSWQKGTTPHFEEETFYYIAIVLFRLVSRLSRRTRFKRLSCVHFIVYFAFASDWLKLARDCDQKLAFFSSSNFHLPDEIEPLSQAKDRFK